MYISGVNFINILRGLFLTKSFCQKLQSFVLVWNFFGAKILAKKGHKNVDEIDTCCLKIKMCSEIFLLHLKSLANKAMKGISGYGITLQQKIVRLNPEGKFFLSNTETIF